MNSIDEVVPAGLAGLRVDRVVALVADVSRSVAASIVEAGGVRVDGRVVTTGSTRVDEGQRILVDVPDPRNPEPTPDETVEFDVAYEDDQLIVVNKPAGLVVHPGAGHESGTLVNGLVARYPEIGPVGEPFRPGIVHRLDRGTSGLLAVARTSQAYESLVEQMQAHEPERIYTALVWGHPDGDSGLIDASVGRSIRKPHSDDGGRNGTACGYAIRRQGSILSTPTARAAHVSSRDGPYPSDPSSSSSDWSSGGR